MVARDITLPVDRDEAWDALTDAERLEAWFADEAAIELEEGGAARFVLPGGEERHGVTVTESATGPWALAAA
jgi:uncharacterized protein YndB with AHSA1/START domain